MSNCNNKKLSKIQIKNSIAILSNNKYSEALATKFEPFDLVNR